MYLYVSPFNFQNYSRYTPSGIYQNCNTIGVTCDGLDYGMSGTLYVTLKVIVRIKQSYLLMSSIKSFFQRCVRQRDLQVCFANKCFLLLRQFDFPSQTANNITMISECPQRRRRKLHLLLQG